MTTTKILPVLTWRAAICKSDLPPTTRHVALTVSLYMSELGDSAYPGAARLVNDTGLSERTIRDHLAALVEAGWLELVHKGGQAGDRKTANEYRANIPDLSPTPAAADPSNSCTRASDDTDPCSSFRPPLQQLHPISSKNSSRSLHRAREITTETVRNAIAEVFGTQPATSSERGHWQRAAGEIAIALRALDNLEIDLEHEISRRVAAWANRYSAPLTPTSLAKHWSALAAPPPTPTPSTTPGDRTCPLGRCDGTGLILPDNSDEAHHCPCRTKDTDPRRPPK